MKYTSNGFIWPAIVIVVALLGVAGIYLFHNQSQEQAPEQSSQNSDIFALAASKHIQSGKSSQLQALESMSCTTADSTKLTQQERDWQTRAIPALRAQLETFRQILISERAKFNTLKSEVAQRAVSTRKGSETYSYVFMAADSLNIGGDRLTDLELSVTRLSDLLSCKAGDALYFKIYQEIVPNVPFLNSQTSGKQSYFVSEIASAAWALAEAKK